MLLLTEDALLVCDHELGTVGIQTSQTLVTIDQRRLLVEVDPEARPIKGCPNVSVTIKPCQHTLPVKQGYSELLFIEGRRICLDSVRGLTDGTPPGAIYYKVRKAGQEFVSEE
jgi:hypothetical protein